MAKFYGSIVKTGRVGGSVFYVNRGTTIERQYQPVVSNPSTTMQVEQRAKMKLASQLSALLAPELSPFGRDGMMTSRNLFVMDLFNHEAFTYASGKASVNRSAIRLTKSRIDMLDNVAAVGASGQLTVSGRVLLDYRSSIVGVRMVLLQQRVVAGEAGYDLAIVSSKTVVPSNGEFSETFYYNPAVLTTVLVYGFIPESEAAVTHYQNLVAENNSEALSLEVVRRTLASGLLYSATSNISVLAQ